MNKKYTAFTLVEMLIVMGILVVLMAIGISVGRFAVQRSQDIHHRDAAKELYTALIRYKYEHGKYPELGTCSGCVEREMFADLLGYNGGSAALLPYLEEEDGFNGGSDTTFYYAVDSIDAQFVVVCVSLGGIDDEAQERGFFCTGDGLGALPESNPVSSVEVGTASEDLEGSYVKSMDDSDWTKDSGFAASTN